MTKLKKPKSSGRHKARELVLQSLYATDCGSSDNKDSFEQLSSQISISERHKEFAGQLYSKTREQINWADEQIAGLAKNWEVKRINSIDKNIIRMAMVEIRFVPDTPVKVVINEAIELAKTFSTKESASFVNGILDAFSKSVSS